MTTQSEVKHLFNEDQITSVNAYFDVEIDSEYVKMQITARFGATPQTISDQIAALVEGYKLARQTYPRPNFTPVKSPDSGEGEKKSFEPKTVPQGELPEGLPEGIEVFKEDFDEIEIIPQTDNKATVAFYRDGLKYPVGAKINKWKNESVAQALQPFGDIDVSKAQKFRAAGSQYYSKGSEYIVANGVHKGEKSHYKDFRLAVARF